MIDLTPQQQRMLEGSLSISDAPPDRIDFLHAILCQVGMPRKKVEGDRFERTSGRASMVLRAGELWTGTKWRQLPLPYGPKPRLVMVHISSEAVRTQSRQIEVGDSIRGFVRRLGIPDQGGPRGGYTMFKKQMEALAACHLTLGLSGSHEALTMDGKPIEKFKAWLRTEPGQTVLWPGELELSQTFFNTLVEHAVPLDPRALGTLQDSALALDIYSWLAHRLCRIHQPEGVKLSWQNLRDQFGQEYKETKDFKKKFRIALNRALVVYPDAKVESIPGGLLLRPSRPALAKTQIVVPKSPLSV